MARFKPWLKNGIAFMLVYLMAVSIPLNIWPILAPAEDDGGYAMFAIAAFVRTISAPGYILATQMEDSDMLTSLFPSIEFFSMPIIIAISALAYFIAGAIIGSTMAAMRQSSAKKPSIAS